MTITWEKVQRACDKVCKTKPDTYERWAAIEQAELLTNEWLQTHGESR